MCIVARLWVRTPRSQNPGARTRAHRPPPSQPNQHSSPLRRTDPSDHSTAPSPDSEHLTISSPVRSDFHGKPGRHHQPSRASGAPRRAAAAPRGAAGGGHRFRRPSQESGSGAGTRPRTALRAHHFERGRVRKFQVGVAVERNKAGRNVEAAVGGVRAEDGKTRRRTKAVCRGAAKDVVRGASGRGAQGIDQSDTTRGGGTRLLLTYQLLSPRGSTRRKITCLT